MTAVGRVRGTASPAVIDRRYSQRPSMLSVQISN
jgi:hypothetical protein